MEFKDIFFTCAIPKHLWIKDIIYDSLKKFPPKLFDEVRPWGSIMTQYPFIQKFSIAKAMETIYKVRGERTVLNEIIFPIDARASEDNLNQFIQCKPIRLMVTGDINSSFDKLIQLLAKEFNTNIITPKQLVEQEIAQRTKIGVWLKKNQGIPSCIVMNLLEQELEKEKYLVNGFILSGFPMISNLNTNATCDLEINFLDQVLIYPDGNEILRNCVKQQLDFIRNLCFRPDYIIYLDTYYYTNKFAQTIEIFQEFVLFYFRENVIRIDCRIGIDAIFTSIKNRFKYMNFKVNYDCSVMNECQNDKMSLDELCDVDKILPNYKWWISKFGRICPVNLYQGRLRFCDTKFPVRFLRYIFVCLSEQSRMQFIQNPGKYMDVAPKCRIAIIGPHKTGKTILSQFFGKLFKADIYQNHIQKSQHFDIIGETRAFIDQSIRENEVLKQNKIEEWTTVVSDLLNDLVSNIFNEKRKQQRFDDLISIYADQFFQDILAMKTSSNYPAYVMKEQINFQNSVDNITSSDFLTWVESKSKSDLLYPQYVIDSAPLNISFWKDLLNKDELPDCVFFLKISSIAKLMDIYSHKHNIGCINKKHILNILSSKFVEFKNLFSLNVELIQDKNSTRLNSNNINKSLMEKVYENVSKFIENYQEIQQFFNSNNVTCIDVDISNQTWTQSILNALVEYLSLYQRKATSEYNNFDNRNEEFYDSTSTYSSIEASEESTECDNSSANYNRTYGSCLDWCPVSLCQHNILKKGYLVYSAQYHNRMYTMHSRADLTEFLSNPILYSRSIYVVPPPRIFIIGLNHRSKNNFADYLASSLNVESFSYKQNPTTMDLSASVSGKSSIQQFIEYYTKIKQHFFEELAPNYKKGVVVFGFPFLFEQFKDLIDNNFYPECILMFDDEVETFQAFYRYVARLNMMQALAASTLVDYNEPSSPEFRASSVTSYIESLSDNQKHDIEIKCYHLIQLFQHEILKIEENCRKLGIAILKVPKNFKLSKQVSSVVEHINNHHYREALFENIRQSTIDESKLLLNSGYYRFSRFKYSCPVDVSRLVTINQFEGMQTQGKVYPCIYLDFIYFICGKKNLKDFKWNPLKYISTCNPPQLQDPIRIAVFGASKSGVSTICRSVAQEFGFKILCPKHVQNKSESAFIDLLKMEKSSTPNGIVLDNFPLSPTLLHEAAICTVDISVVFIIVSSFRKVLQNWSTQNQNLKNIPSVSLSKVLKSFCETSETIKSLQKSNATSLLNIHYLDGDGNSWTILDKVRNEIIKTTRCITSYKIKLIKNRCANLGYLNMFYDSLIFKREINHFYCQPCLSLGKLKAFKYFYVNVGPEFYTEKCQALLCQPYGYTNDELYETFNFGKPFEANEIIEPLATQTKNVMCMFQYIHVFYWACNDHTINFMLNTQQYFKDSEKLKPLFVPFLVIAYTKEYVAFQGFCPVEYERGKLVKGAMNLSVYYRKKVYLLANKENTHEFLIFPEKYRNIKFDLSSHSQQNTIFKGLSQDLITNIVQEVSNLRPTHFALGGRLSATTLIGLKLKYLNSCAKYNDYWNTSIYDFLKDCKKIQDEIRMYQKNSKRFIISNNFHKINKL